MPRLGKMTLSKKQNRMVKNTLSSGVKRIGKWTKSNEGKEVLRAGKQIGINALKSAAEAGM